MSNRIIFSVFCFLSFILSLNAQDDYVSSVYDRPSLTTLFFDEYGFDSDRLNNAFKKIDAGDKYFINQLDYNSLSTSLKLPPVNIAGERKKYASKENKNFLQNILLANSAILKPEDEFGLTLGEVLQNKFNIGGEIMSLWTKQDANGNFEVVNNRSGYNLNSNEIKNEADAQKLSNFKELLFKNYILVYHFGDSTDKGSINLRKENEVYNMLFTVYVYKVDIDESTFGKILAPNFKNSKFIKNHNFPIRYVGRFIDEASVSPSDRRAKENLKALTTRFTKKGASEDELITASNQKEAGYLDVEVTMDEIYQDLMQEGFDLTMNLSEREVEDFKVRAPIIKGIPLKAEIGKREGLKPDQRYFVYQYKADNDTNEVESDVIGVVRVAGKIADNVESLQDQNGEFLKTNFKQTYGGNIKEGMYVVQHNDLGVKFAIGTGLKNFRIKSVDKIEGGATLTIGGRVEYNFTKMISNLFDAQKLYGMHAFIGIDAGRLGKVGSANITSLQLNFGLSKNIYFSRKFDLIPYIAFVSEQSNIIVDGQVGDFTELYQFLDIGCRSAIPISPTFSIEPSISFPIGIGERSKDGVYSGPVHFTLNGRFEF